MFCIPTCCYCGQEIQSDYNLRFHIASKHPDAIITNPEKVKVIEKEPKKEEENKPAVEIIDLPDFPEHLLEELV